LEIINTIRKKTLLSIDKAVLSAQKQVWFIDLCVCVFVFSIKHCTVLSNNVDHLLLNLTLSDIMVSLANASTLQNDSSWIETIRKFVTETLKGGTRLNSKQLNRLLGVSWRLIQMQPNRGRWCRREDLGLA
jgi:hypothetical protein